jgi:phage shock protein PspC (stress-responsive transcriptional regulator)
VPHQEVPHLTVTLQTVPHQTVTHQTVTLQTVTLQTVTLQTKLRYQHRLSPAARPGVARTGARGGQRNAISPLQGHTSARRVPSGFTLDRQTRVIPDGAGTPSPSRLIAMSETQHDRTAGPGAPSGDWWNRRPYRSTNDRKIAGVAGGLGRAFGVDPVLIRVGFVIATIFGGFGLLLYVLGWLLLPADGDQVSAAESLLGRGRSSTPPALAVGLSIVAVIAMFSMFSWGRPFWPLVIIGIVAIVVARKRAAQGGCAGHRNQQQMDDWAKRMSQKGESWGAAAEQWIAKQPWSGTGENERKSSTADSPFEKPAFWDEEGAAPRVNLSKDSGIPAEPTPPAWDPLGVAPFAWDLPDPAPAPPAPPAPRQRSMVGRVTMGVVLLVAGLATAGIFAGWWQLSWAGVAATALAVVAIGLLIGSLRGRGQSLIGPGIFLSLVTLALTITGIDGTSGYGQQTWAPTSQASLQQEYVLNGGQGELDLRNLAVPAGSTLATEVEVRAGQASVIVPDDVAVNVTCTTNAGEVDCLGSRESGLRQEVTVHQPGSSDLGTINLNVHVGAGQAEVRNG